MKTPDDTSAGAAFLEWDFTECYAQLRHYDAQLWDVWKFSLTAYSTLLGAALAAYQFSVEKHVDLIPAARAALGVGVLLGIVFLGLAVRTRIYYVVVARYINHYRDFFLAMKPYGFENITGMYSDPRYPRYFNWRSTQEWLLYAIALLNTTLAGVFLWMTLSGCWKMPGSIVFASLFLVLQLALSIRTLNACEAKPPAQIVFGHRFAPPEPEASPKEDV